jgi:hypothetical protein
VSGLTTLFSLLHCFITFVNFVADEMICFWISVDTNCEMQPVAFAPIASFFGLWHEHRRGNHQGVHEFYWEGNYLLLLNVYDESSTHGVGGGGAAGKPEKRTFKHLMPPEIRPLRHTGQFDKSLLSEYKRRNLHIVTTKAERAGMSCSDVCAARGQRCQAENLPLINTCAALQEAFSCTSCTASNGAEQPAYVDPQADASFGPGQCLYNAGPEVSTCEASHHATLRLCPCAERFPQ